ncbi:EF-hand calcium-binding domain-containing protein 11 isoform X2 [Bubalus kerabau]|uniref:EF-hand calcium-binding domain-containing protein 11 isoform X2 n=1 Tax=Bubalus carabanensis TaxID=3119969 RepID=UPI00244EE652|nr:EF-hand calcium-binding domain-containing protein 11 isoform X2 [Bubalus carabanensis]
MFYSQAGARPRTWEASPPEHKKWVEVFKACDEDNKGYLSREDFKVAVVMLFGYKPSKIEADSVMSSVDPNTSGILLKEFLDIVRKKKEAQVYRNEVRHIFTAFDRHYRGYLTLEDFKKAFKQVAPKLSERIILEVFSVISSPRVVDSSRAGVRTLDGLQCGQRQARGAEDSSLVPLCLLSFLPQVAEALWPVPSASPPGGGCA